jgi:hypothetical protein
VIAACVLDADRGRPEVHVARAHAVRIGSAPLRARRVWRRTRIIGARVAIDVATITDESRGAHVGLRAVVTLLTGRRTCGGSERENGGEQGVTNHEDTSSALESNADARVRRTSRQRSGDNRTDATTKLPHAVAVTSRSAVSYSAPTTRVYDAPAGRVSRKWHGANDRFPRSDCRVRLGP